MHARIDTHAACMQDLPNLGVIIFEIGEVRTGVSAMKECSVPVEAAARLCE